MVFFVWTTLIESHVLSYSSNAYIEAKFKMFHAFRSNYSGYNLHCTDA